MTTIQKMSGAQDVEGRFGFPDDDSLVAACPLADLEEAPGKFEGCRKWVEAAYQQSLSGFSRDDFGDVNTYGLFADWLESTLDNGDPAKDEWCV